MSYELGLKLKYLRSILSEAEMKRVIDGGGVRTTLDEIIKLNSAFSLAGREVVSVCDRIHARRVHYFWRKVAPSVGIKIATVAGTWDKRMPSLFMHSDFRYLIGNILNLAMFMIIGKKMINMAHKVAKKN
jgi:hypothetical protein